QEHVRRAVRMAMHCHTSALGGHVERCPDGHIERIFYNSCGHRFCPRCAGRKRRSWLIAQRAKLLPVRHDHVVFTLPHAVNPLWRRNPQVMGDLLFHSATDALRELLGDERRLGAEPGITVTLETWDDRLKFHPHLPCLVTGGGLSPEGEFESALSGRREAPHGGIPQTMLSEFEAGADRWGAQPAGGHDDTSLAQHAQQGEPAEVGGLYRHTAGRRRTEPRRYSALSGQGCGRRTGIRRAGGLHQRAVGDAVGVPDIGPAERDPIG
ncbi:MAG: transposase, partial [bacterium]|nr:transposase [bacterium]